MHLMKQGLFSRALVFGLVALNIGTVALASEDNLILPSQANSNLKLAIQTESGDIDPATLLQVFVGPKNTCCQGKSPMAGSYTVTNNTVIFDPAFDFIMGQRYTVSTRRGDGSNTVTPVLNEFSIESAIEAIKPEVLMVYPSTTALPENTLRFYIHFSTPMKPHLAEKFIRLVDAEGSSDNTAFMTFKQELWSADRKRLTLLMDPGRIKRGVAQNLTQGPALLEGNNYSIVVDDGWPSASGRQESPMFEKTFSVISPLRKLPDVKLWTVQSPETKTSNPLVIKFDRPFDHQLVQSAIKVLDDAENIIAGTVSIEDNETTWRFQPKSEWSGASLQLVVDARLEDVAGNNFKDLLDHSVKTELKSYNEIRFSVDLKP